VPQPSVTVHPVTAERWEDLTALFGQNGAYSGCWCMWWRESAKDFERLGSQGNRRAMRSVVRRGAVPGLLAYRDGRPVGWVSIAPRSEFPRLQRSPRLKPVDGQPVWSVVCFFIHRRHRRTGVARALLAAAIDHAARNGARIVEAYPVDPAARRYSNAEAYTGLVPLFEEAGFREVARRENRPIMRKRVAVRRARSGERSSA
jgi:GNAT superfamily N-acetyltransferase